MGKTPHKRGCGGRGEAPKFRTETLWISISPHGPAEVRMGNLGVWLG